MNTRQVCLIIYGFFKSWEPEIAFVLICTPAEQFHVSNQHCCALEILIFLVFILAIFLKNVLYLTDLDRKRNHCKQWFDSFFVHKYCKNWQFAKNWIQWCRRFFKLTTWDVESTFAISPMTMDTLTFKGEASLPPEKKIRFTKI